MKRPLKPLSEQAILITGASSGIGLATAKAAAARGASVMLVARNEPALAEAVRTIEAAGGTAAYAVADVGDRAAVRRAGAAAVARFGRVDSWINNAGVAVYAPLTDTPLDEHERMMRTNYFGTVNGAQIAWELMRETGGALITVGSIAGEMPSPVLGAYVATKHAVKGFLESLRIEFDQAGTPIQVTLIAPAGVDTPINMHAANHLPDEALAPQPAYDVEDTVRAILNAAEHPRRHVTVGGMGRVVVLFAEHFPRLFGRLAPASERFMRTGTLPKSDGNNLFASRGPYRERSGEQGALPISGYNVAGRHPIATASAAAMLTALLLIARRRR